jgi:hypothetical protein
MREISILTQKLSFSKTALFTTVVAYHIIKVIAPLNTQLNLFHDSTALGGLDHVTVEISRGHSDGTHPVGLLWTSDQPEAEFCT